MNRNLAQRTLSAALIAAVLNGCSTLPDQFDLSTDKASDEGHFRVVLIAPAEAPAINQLHAWRVKLTTPDGTPVSGARFGVGGGMPQHGHGLPTRPRVTGELADGVYILEGMKFNMPGWWQLKFDIRAQHADRVTFNTLVAASASRR